MISLNKYIKESLSDDDDVLMKDTGEDTIKNEIREYLKENYKGHCKTKFIDEHVMKVSNAKNIILAY